MGHHLNAHGCICFDTYENCLMVAVDVCQSRWRMLREKYAREKKAERISSPGENASRPKWMHMDQLAFLDPHIRPRNTYSGKSMVQRTQDNGEDKKFLYKLDPDMDEAIEVVPVLLEEDDDDMDIIEQLSSISPSDSKEAARPAPTVVERRQHAASAAIHKRHKPDWSFDRRSRSRSAVTNRQHEFDWPTDLPTSSGSAVTLLRIIDKLSSPQEEDCDELFGRMVSAELRSITDAHRKRKMKFEIQTILFGDS